ncbi:hypothetical protein HAX54_007724 [Datura stramonium]|uniref:Uncharacterized protein n=1 Tax=Datura stramonium TaxID=4076 RepID=A0ABS8WXG2_DATST|nr:hypothetical protein [Datura stramonium]
MNKHQIILGITNDEENFLLIKDQRYKSALTSKCLVNLFSWSMHAPVISCDQFFDEICSLALDIDQASFCKFNKLPVTSFCIIAAFSRCLLMKHLFIKKLHSTKISIVYTFYQNFLFL